MTYLWIKALHIIAVICWFAAMLYLPRLFVYHSETTEKEGKERFKIMERKLYKGIMTPAMAVAIVSGLFLAAKYGFGQGYWLHVKLVLVASLVVYHLKCSSILKQFARDENKRSHVFYRWFNEVPAVLLVVIVVLVVVKPF